MTTTTQQIPDLDQLKTTITNMKKLFEYSIEYCDAILNDIKTVDHINNLEKSNYLNCKTEIDYLISDYRSDVYAPFSSEHKNLKEFRDNLNSFDSDLFYRTD
jgi:hypothetical protein